MKIVQDPESGKVGIQLKKNEQYDLEDHLQSLTEFLSVQALEIHQLKLSYKRAVERLEALEKTRKYQ
jgi:hypothetical protein